MQRRRRRGSRTFARSLGVVLLAGAASAGAWWVGYPAMLAACNTLIVVAAVVAIVAGVREWTSRRTSRPADFSVGAGHYTLDHFRARAG